MNSVDDRGNVLDIWIDGEPTGRLDREADAIPDIDDGDTFAWEGGKEEMIVARENGYGEDLAMALLCGFLRGESTAKEQAIQYLRIALNAEE